MENKEVAIWKSVVVQALIDIKSDSNTKDTKSKKKQALTWLNKENEYFKTVCNFADLDYEKVYNVSQKIIKNEYSVYQRIGLHR